MEKKKQKDILMLAMRAGNIMMKSGAEIYRVEDTIERICKSCGIEEVNVFATPTGIFVSTDNEEASNTVSYIKRIKSSETDLTRISRVNQFSRSFTTTDMTVEEGNRLLDDIENSRPYPFWIRALAAAMVAGCFGVIFGGGALDFCVAVIVGLKALNRPCKVTPYSDSQYVVNMVKLGWMEKWKRNGWMRNKSDPAKNVDLLKQLDELLHIHQVEMIWVKGHAEDETNNRCDALAVAERDKRIKVAVSPVF